MKKNIQESFVGKTLNRKTSDIVPKKLELDEQSFFSLLSEYTDSLGIITNLSNGDIVDTKSESGREFPVVVKKEVKRYLFKPVSGLVGGSFVVSLVVSPYSYFWGKATEIPVFDLDFKVLFYPNNNEIRIGIYVNNYKAKCCRKNGVSYEVVPRHFFRKSDGRFLDKSHDFFRRPQEFFELTKMGVDSDTLEICKNYIKRIADFKVEPEKGVGVLNLSNDSLEDSVIKVQSIFGDELFCLEEKVLESFTKKVSRKNSSDLVPDIDYPDGVYILHDILGVKGVEGWNPRNNYGVVGILVVEGEHKIVVALEDSPENLHWSTKHEIVNQSVNDLEDAESDFNGEIYCKRFVSPDFPAAYYCKTYNKGNRNWYLPSSGELWLIYNHLEEIQNVLSIVGGQNLITTWDKDVPVYWSSTEQSAANAWCLTLNNGRLTYWRGKVTHILKVRPVSNFRKKNTLRESFTKKISSKKNTDLISKPPFVLEDGVYILHETLGVRGVEGWNPKFNNGVVGILLIENDHKIVVALKDSPKNLHWSKKRKLVNQPFDESEKSDFNGEYYCQKLNSSNFPAAYYCKTYNKGGRNWYLPSSGELWLIYQHLEEIQNALSIVGGQRFVTVRGEDTPVYWSSTEDSAMYAWAMGIGNIGWCNKIGDRYKVRPVSNFNLSELKESFVKKTRKSNSEDIVHDADDKAFNPVMDAKEFINRLEECILSYKQPYVYGKKNPYNLEKFSFEMITSWPNTFKFNRQNYNSSELLFDVSNSKKPSFRIKLTFFVNFYNHSKNIICYLTVGSIKLNKEGIYEDRLFQYIYDSKKKRISFVENPEGVRFDDNMESIEPTLRNLNFILNDIKFLMDNWKILYKTYLKKNSFETWNEFYKMLPSQNNKGFDFDLKESFTHKISKKTSASLKGGEMFGEMESFGEFDMLFKKFLKKHEHQFSSCFTTNYPFKSKMITRIGYKVVLKKDCPFEDGSDDRTVLRLSLDVFQRDIMNFPEDQYLNTPHGILTVAFYTELGPSTPQQINLANLEFIGGNESPVDFRFVKFKERREWEKPNFSYQLLFGLERFLMALVETMNNMDEQTWSEIGRTSANFNPFKGEACCGADSKIILDILEKHGFYSELHKNFSKVNLSDLNESFTKKISSKKNTDLIPDLNYPDGVYILHETLGVKTVEEWNTKFNNGVLGILLIEDDHKIVVALEESPKELHWSKEYKLVNQPIERKKDAESDFNGEEYCRNLNSPDFFAAYYCLNYDKGGRNWYLPSSGELWLIYRHLEEIQKALSIVGGQKFVTTRDDNGIPKYWSSSENCTSGAWYLHLGDDSLYYWPSKVSCSGKVRPISKFQPSGLKESFTKKISSKKNTDLVPDMVYPDGVYILHETLGVQDAETWDSKYNKGVVGVLLIHNEHKFVASVDVSPKLYWSEKTGNFTAEQYRSKSYALGDYDSESNCSRLNSPEFPAAYYCHTYKKGGRKWRLGSLGEMSLLMVRYRRDFDRILEKVGAVNLKERAKTSFNNWYWTSTEYSKNKAWTFYLDNRILAFGAVERYKTEDTFSVIPISTFEYDNLGESFTHRVSRKRSSDLVSDIDYPDGVYILHETLGVKTVDGWNSENNNGVVGVLVVEDGHKIVVALEDSPENLTWSEKRELINQPVEEIEEVETDFNGEYYYRKPNSPDFPAAYYCLNYKKGGRSWYLPSSGELWLIYNHLEEIQNALSIVGGQKFVTTWDEDTPVYWSSTENSAPYAWVLGLSNGRLSCWRGKVSISLKVRPVSKFGFSTLKESFTRKIRSKKNDELTAKADTAFEIPDGVYILHETLGVKSVNGWNPKDNKGVVGILLVEDDYKIVVALENSPKMLRWSTKYELINESIEEDEDVESDFNGENHCINLNSPDFPAAYYCLNYKKGGRKWHLPSSGELWLIYNHLEEIQTALKTVGGQKFDTSWDEGYPIYWSSTELNTSEAWELDLSNDTLLWYDKVEVIFNVRPVSKFGPSTLKESFTRKISRKKNDELISKSDTVFFEIPDGVYILHQTLGVRTVDSWNPKDNEGVVGILVIEDDHKIMVALEDSPEDLLWSKERKLVNEPIEEEGDVASDFNGEKHCINLNSPDFPAAYYCKTYNKGGRSWYLPSAGELWLIYNHLEEIQSALEVVGGKKFVTSWFDGYPVYWSSTECSFPEDSATYACVLKLPEGYLEDGCKKIEDRRKVRPVSKFGTSKTLKESFTRKIRSKKNDELISKTGVETFIPDGVYILHETLGVRTVNEWNPENNDGVVGVLVVEDDHKIVVALEDAPENLHWSKNYGLFNQSVEDIENAESDFNGEQHCLKFNSLIFPAAYYCLHYKKGGREWYLPSSGELWLIYNHLEEIQTALSVVGGQKLITTWDDGTPLYWSSTENSATNAWLLYLYDGYLKGCGTKVEGIAKVRPVSIFYQE